MSETRHWLRETKDYRLKTQDPAPNYGSGLFRAGQAEDRRRDWLIARHQLVVSQAQLVRDFRFAPRSNC